MKVILDTNILFVSLSDILFVSLSEHSSHHIIFKSLMQGK